MLLPLILLVGFAGICLAGWIVLTEAGAPPISDEELDRIFPGNPHDPT